MFFLLFGDQMPLGDLHFFLLRVTRQLNHLHPVQQRPGDGIQVVGCGNKEDIRQIKRQLNKMISERVILLGVEDFQQSGSRISSEIAGQLIDLVHQNQGVSAARLL